MSIIDFKEIPRANDGGGEQDAFELFARDFVKGILTFEILSEPNRGADGGKDFLARETRSGKIGQSQITWLVSCKHLAHSGKSVTPEDELNISDRIHQHTAQGFIGFYSTIASSGLNSRLDALKKDWEICIFDCKSIEGYLIEYAKGSSLVKRYFPHSFLRLEEEHRSPTVLLDEYIPLNCEICGKDLIAARDGLVLFVENYASQEIVDVVGVCRGKCDHEFVDSCKSKGLTTAWEDIKDFSLPTIYLEKQMAIINSLFYNETYFKFTKAGIEAYKDFLIAISQLVLRKYTATEKERVIALNQIPEGL